MLESVCSRLVCLCLSSPTLGLSAPAGVPRLPTRRPLPLVLLRTDSGGEFDWGGTSVK